MNNYKGVHIAPVAKTWEVTYKDFCGNVIKKDMVAISKGTARKNVLSSKTCHTLLLVKEKGK